MFCLFHVFQIFPANVNNHDIAEIPFPEPIVTRYIRIVVKTVEVYANLRFEIFGYDIMCPYRGSYDDLDDIHCSCGQGRTSTHRVGMKMIKVTYLAVRTQVAYVPSYESFVVQIAHRNVKF